MKHTPEDNARILDLHSPVVRVAGTPRQRADKLLAMFDEAEERINREEQHRGNREVFRIKG